MKKSFIQEPTNYESPEPTYDDETIWSNAHSKIHPTK